MLTLAHLSDPHLGPLAAFRFHELLNKRLTGYVNWRRARRHIHDMDILEAVAADIARHAPDHIACTGDVAHIGLKNEFATASRFLAGLGDGMSVSFVPGNHDAYVGESLAHLAREMQPWATGDDGKPGYPWLKIREDVALIGLCSAIPTLPFRATGRLGPDQVADAEHLLLRAAARNLTRVILIHHPPHVGGAKPGRELRDAPAFEAMLARAGADLVLHGHNHTTSLAWRDGPLRKVPIVGVPSASSSARSHYEPAGWHLITIARSLFSQNPGPQITIRRRGLLADGSIGDLGEIDLTG